MSGITEHGKEILRRFESMDPKFAEAAAAPRLPTQRRSFSDDLTLQVNQGAPEADWVAVFTDHEGGIKHKMGVKKMSALYQWEPQKLMNVYGIERQDLLTASAFLVTRMPRDPAVERVLDLH